MRPAHYLFFAVSVLMIAAGVFLMREEPARGPKGDLLLYCAAGVRPPVERIAAEYKARYGTAVKVQYGGSGALLSQIETASMGDLFISADHENMETARGRGRVEETLPIAHQSPAVGVKKGNPKGIRGLNDLLRGDVAVGLCSPAAAIGKVSETLLRNAGLYDSVNSMKKVSFPTVMELANAIAMGALDAGIVWDAAVAQFNDLESVALPETVAGSFPIEVGVLTSARIPSRALHFARYLTAPGKGLLHFEALGFRTAPGDEWAERPRISLYCGGVLRPAVTGIVEEFKTRENVDVDLQFNGCGILLGSIKAGFKPDAYVACDRSFVDPVAPEFLEVVPLTRTEIVLITPRGNPKQIRSLHDLAKPGFRIGLAHEEKSTLGALTRGLLRETRLYDAVRKNTVQDPATADLLVTSVLLGAVDAALVYRANTVPQAAKLDVLPLTGTGPRFATQTIALHRESTHPALAGRLLHKIRGSKNVFLANGFEWLGR